MSAFSRSNRSFSDHLLNHCLSFPRYDRVTGAHGACFWNGSVWIQWCVGTEDNYFLCNALDAGLSPWGCAVLVGWGGSWRTVLVGCPAQGLPNSLQHWDPLVLLSLYVTRLSGSLSRPFACSGVATWSPGQRPWTPAFCRDSVETSWWTWELSWFGDLPA